MTDELMRYVDKAIQNTLESREVIDEARERTKSKGIIAAFLPDKCDALVRDHDIVMLKTEIKAREDALNDFHYSFMSLFRKQVESRVRDLEILDQTDSRAATSNIITQQLRTVNNFIREIALELADQKRNAASIEDEEAREFMLRAIRREIKVADEYLIQSATDLEKALKFTVGKFSDL